MVVYKLGVGGNERDLSKLARFLNPERYQVHVAAFHADGERRAELDAAGIPVLSLPMRSFRDRSFFDCALRLRAYLQLNRVQILHAFDSPTSIFAVPVGRLIGVPAVVSSHCFFRLLIAPPEFHLLRVVDRLAHRIVVNADAIKRNLVEDYRVLPERVFVSPNGVETEVFFPRAERRPPILDHASLVVGSLCVFRKEKRLELLLEAFSRVLARDPRMRLLIVGDGVMREEWMARRDALGLGHACHFELTTTDVPYWMRCMDVFVLPSLSEGFPNTVLEAMACGCCVVASAVGGVPELVDHFRTGLLFTSGDADDLADKLFSLLENPELRRAMGAAAAAEAKVRFSMGIVALRMERFYDSLLTQD